jgi:hypothetical protein
VEAPFVRLDDPPVATTTADRTDRTDEGTTR